MALGSYLFSFTPSTMVRSSLLAGAEMMTFLTVPLQVGLGLVASVKWPVDSITTWAPAEDQSSLAGSRSAKTFKLLAVDGDEVVPRDDGVGQVTQDGVILEQMGQRCRAGQVIDRYKFNFRIAERGPEHVAADTAKAIDANLYCHKLWDLLEGG